MHTLKIGILKDMFNQLQKYVIVDKANINKWEFTKGVFKGEEGYELSDFKGEIKTGDGLLYDEIGYLPQQTEAQKDFPASVREIVLSGNQSRCGKRPFYNKDEKQLAKDNMKKMGIYELRKRCYRELSGGQQQRVLLARALCATQKMLLLDEPVTGLDPKVSVEMYELIEELHKEGITIIMISHDMEAAVKYATHILHIGNDTFFGTKEEYLCWKK